MIVVSNTSPLHYLILIEAEHVLPKLYGEVIIPSEVLKELNVEAAPDRLREWIESPPKWLDVRQAPPHQPTEGIHIKEASAIALAKALRADLLLMDDRDGRAFAEAQRLRVTGLLDVLRDAAESDMINLDDTIRRLRETNFRATPRLYDELLTDFHNWRRSSRQE